MPVQAHRPQQPEVSEHLGNMVLYAGQALYADKPRKHTLSSSSHRSKASFSPSRSSPGLPVASAPGSPASRVCVSARHCVQYGWKSCLVTCTFPDVQVSNGCMVASKHADMHARSLQLDMGQLPGSCTACSAQYECMLCTSALVVYTQHRCMRLGARACKEQLMWLHAPSHSTPVITQHASRGHSL